MDNVLSSFSESRLCEYCDNMVTIIRSKCVQVKVAGTWWFFLEDVHCTLSLPIAH